MVFRTDLVKAAEYDLGNVVGSEVQAANPVAMCSVPGYDASFRVDHLVSTSDGARCASIAMGSQEGFILADQAIAAASRMGTWVLLKNVHLAPSWLGDLEKRLHSMNMHRNFRLFMTLEMNNSIPTSILRQSRVIMNEPPPGMRANLLDSLRNISTERMTSGTGPVERFRLYFNLAWLHAILIERLRYVPLGFSKFYEFNDADFEAALSTIDSWIGTVAKGRANVDPASIPFPAIATILKQAVYGGRVDDENDQRLLNGFIDSIFTAKTYENGFVLVQPEFATDKPVVAPEGARLQDYIDWSTTLPEREVSCNITVTFARY
jgi:dynein heavy chain 1